MLAVISSDVISPRGGHVTGDVWISGPVQASRMDSRSAEPSGRLPVCYHIVVRGEMTERFAEVLDGVAVDSAGAESILRVENADQAKLQAILGWLYDHGIELVSVRRAEGTNPDGMAPVA